MDFTSRTDDTLAVGVAYVLIPLKVQGWVFNHDHSPLVHKAPPVLVWAGSDEGGRT